MPGLIRGIARTAVVAGTATAVSGRVQRRQAEKFAGRDANIAAEREQAYQQQVGDQQQGGDQEPAPEPAPAAAPDSSSMLDQLQKLGDLKAQGILTEEEFAAQKAKLLNS